MIKSFIKLSTFLFLIIIFQGCGSDDWRDPLGISSSGSGRSLNPDGTPYVPKPGHLEISSQGLEQVPYKQGTSALQTSIILKNTGTEDLMVVSVSLDETWLSVSGIGDNQIIEPFDSVEVWVGFGDETLTDGTYLGAVSFQWNSLENPDSTEDFSVSLEVGNESAWDIIYDDIIDKTCSCHLTSSGAGELKMGNQDLAYSNLVNVIAYEIPELKLVEVYFPDLSYLVKKIKGVDIEGDRMPRDGPPFLSDNRIAQIIQWISVGAPE